MTHYYGECVEVVSAALRGLVQIGEEFDVADVCDLVPDFTEKEVRVTIAGMARRYNNKVLERVSIGRYQLIAQPYAERTGKLRKTTVDRGTCGCGMKRTTSSACSMGCED